AMPVALPGFTRTLFGSIRNSVSPSWNSPFSIFRQEDPMKPWRYCGISRQWTARRSLLSVLHNCRKTTSRKRRTFWKPRCAKTAHLPTLERILPASMRARVTMRALRAISNRFLRNEDRDLPSKGHQFLENGNVHAVTPVLTEVEQIPFLRNQVEILKGRLSTWM